MKTKIIGVFAVILAISLSAFTYPKKKVRFDTGSYWFLIANGITKGAHPVPKADATFIQQSPLPPDEEALCSGSNNQCLDGFSASQINTMTFELKDDNEISVQQVLFQN